MTRSWREREASDWGVTDPRSAAAWRPPARRVPESAYARARAVLRGWYREEALAILDALALARECKGECKGEAGGPKGVEQSPRLTMVLGLSPGSNATIKSRILARADGLPTSVGIATQDLSVPERRALGRVLRAFMGGRGSPTLPIDGQGVWGIRPCDVVAWWRWGRWRGLEILAALVAPWASVYAGRCERGTCNHCPAIPPTPWPCPRSRERAWRMALSWHRTAGLAGAPAWVRRHWLQLGRLGRAVACALADRALVQTRERWRDGRETARWTLEDWLHEYQLAEAALSCPERDLVLALAGDREPWARAADRTGQDRTGQEVAT